MTEKCATLFSTTIIMYLHQFLAKRFNFIASFGYCHDNIVCLLSVACNARVL